MKIVDWGKKKTSARLIGCCECEARISLENGEAIPEKCPVCGASKTSLYTVDTKRKSQSLHPAARAFPELYDERFIGDATADILATQKTIDYAIEAYYKANCGYAFVEGEGIFVAVFQEDDTDRDDYFVMVTDSYREVNSYELEA